MADLIFNIAKGALVEKVRDGSANLIVILLEAIEADSTIKDYDDLNALFLAAGNTEATATGYARKTGVIGTIVVDDIDNEAEVTIPNQQWTTVTGNAIVAAIVAYEESASETGRIPLTKHDISITPDGTDIMVRFP